jgi:predicted nucleotide-binding protein
MTWTVDNVRQEPVARDLNYEERAIEYGDQFRLGSGEVVNVYDSGKVHVAGKGTQLGAELARLFGSASPAAGSAAASGSVFVVYGHDASAKDALEAMLRRWGLTPLILDQEAASGLTLIEKLGKRVADVSYAAVLMTGDDLARVKGEADAPLVPRARQNVVLELGIFLGRLGRAHVAILYERGVELPSDIHGVEYLPFEKRIEEKKLELAKALANAGFDIDLKKV